MIGDVEARPARTKGLGVFAYRPIARGDEITIDYRLNAFDDDGEPWPCACGTSRCTGEVACSFFVLDEATQEEYLPHAPAFIRREWHRRRRRPGDPRSGPVPTAGWP